MQAYRFVSKFHFLALWVLVLATLASVSPAKEDKASKGRRILNRAVEAHGGEKWANLRDMTMDHVLMGTGQVQKPEGGDYPITSRFFWFAPSKWLADMKIRGMPPTIYLWDGAQWWERSREERYRRTIPQSGYGTSIPTLYQVLHDAASGRLDAVFSDYQPTGRQPSGCGLTDCRILARRGPLATWPE